MPGLNSELSASIVALETAAQEKLDEPLGVSIATSRSYQVKLAGTFMLQLKKARGDRTRGNEEFAYASVAIEQWTAPGDAEVRFSCLVHEKPSQKLSGRIDYRPEDLPHEVPDGSTAEQQVLGSCLSLAQLVSKLGLDGWYNIEQPSIQQQAAALLQPPADLLAKGLYHEERLWYGQDQDSKLRIMANRFEGNWPHYTMSARRKSWSPFANISLPMACMNPPQQKSMP